MKKRLNRSFDQDDVGPDDQELDESGWKQVHGDVFRAPPQLACLLKMSVILPEEPHSGPPQHLAAEATRPLRQLLETEEECVDGVHRIWSAVAKVRGAAC